MDSSSSAQPVLIQLTPRDLAVALWRNKWFVLCLTMLITVSVGFAARSMPKSYRAVVLLSAATTSASQMGGAGGLASQFGGLASLAGISVGGGDTQKAESLAVLQSEALTEKYIRDNNLLPLLYRDKWDATKSQWKDPRPGKAPTLWTGNAYFKKNIRAVKNDPKTGLVNMTITYTDPVIAAKWANDLVKLTNDYLRDKAVHESERNILYLNEEAAKTNIVEARLAMYKILESELNKEMLARGNSEYAFKILDPAFVPERAFSPDVLLWLIGGCFGGFSLSVLLIYLRATFKKIRKRAVPNR